MNIDYKIQDARIADHDAIYALKSESIRPYVEKIWGWNEAYQQKDFDADFSDITHFQVIACHDEYAGFLQSFSSGNCLFLIEIHLLPQYRGMGIGSDILRTFQELAASQGRKVRVGCFKENARAKALYQRMHFVLAEETQTHFIFEYE